ncbi:MAG: J domain-containing protein [Bacteroidaceae bacterium]|nr:J domain-containing protein [Bacteroidaceae bacterium]MCD8237623.1 DnaJ domain-containing protein [Prevotellaceae bacterium]
MAFIDYYKIMGVPKDTPQSEIKAAYRKRSKQFHPDLHPDDPKAKAKFQLLNEAYAVLNDPDKRAKYDKYGEQWKQAEAYEQAGGGSGPFGGFGGGNPFGFGGGDFGAGNQGGGFSFNMGSGGFSDFFEQLFGGASGRRHSSARHSAGAQPQTDAQSSVSIDMYTALLGGEIILQTQTSKLKLKIKPGTQPGAKVRLKGKGYQRPDGTFGDLIITYNVTLPTQLTERQKELLEEMRHS